MANLLNRNNKHLFLEKPDKSPNSFIANMNSLAKSFRGLTPEEVLALKDIPATIVSLGEEWKLILEETALDLLTNASAFNTAIVTKITEDVPANSEIVLPDIAKYVVGTNMLMLSYNGTVCYLGEQFEEIGEPHTDSNKIRILFDLRTDDILEFRIVALNANVSNSAVIAEGSTEPRALSERFSDIVNVKDFGAKGDGKVDDTQAVIFADAWNVAGSVIDLLGLTVTSLRMVIYSIKVSLQTWMVVSLYGSKCLRRKNCVNYRFTIPTIPSSFIMLIMPHRVWPTLKWMVWKRFSCLSALTARACPMRIRSVSSRSIILRKKALVLSL